MDLDVDLLGLLYRFGAALVMSFLVGLQREYAYRNPDGHKAELFAGTRTFAFFGLYGCSSALVTQHLGMPIIFPVLLLIPGALIAIAYYQATRSGDLGLTTEAAALITLVIGAMCFWGYVDLAGALTVVATLLLALKLQVQTLTRRLTDEDIFATLKFAAITVIVLPLLPRTSPWPAPFDVLVPYKIWLMVVFISGISFLGYILIQFVGARRGVGLTGILGGLASSTAVTLSFSSRSREHEPMGQTFALAILLAWSVMFVRIIIEVAAVNGRLLSVLWLPIAAGSVCCLAYCAYLYIRSGKSNSEPEDGFKNPFEILPALTFGLLYAVILLGSHLAQMYFGSSGLYLSSILAGVADVDAITLSVAELSRRPDHLPLDTAARAIVLAAVSNTLVKGGIVLALGSPSLKKTILPGLILTAAVSLTIALAL